VQRRGNVLKPRLDPPRATGLNAPRELAMPDAVHHPQGSGQRGLVPREGLLERLSGPGAVVLVCAPARSGKTVLVRSWVEDSGLRAAWVSVERGERDGQRFWLALIDALAAAVPAVERVDPAPRAWTPATQTATSTFAGRTSSRPTSSPMCASCPRRMIGY
jgi:hypothetical protein